MTNLDQIIKDSEAEAEVIRKKIEDSEKVISFHKTTISIEKKKLKCVEEGIEVFKKQANG